MIHMVSMALLEAGEALIEAIEQLILDMESTAHSS
jgi:hypothetical protein